MIEDGRRSRRGGHLQQIQITHLSLTDITSLDILTSDMVRRASDDDIKRLLPLPQASFHILVALADQDRHGYAIMQDVASRTDGELKLSPGTLYGSIKRLLESGLIVEIEDQPNRTQDDERRRYYQITAFGREVAQAEADRLAALLRQARAVGIIARRT